MATSRLIARSPIALSGLLLAAVLALASEEGAAEPAIARHEHERPAPAARACTPTRHESLFKLDGKFPLARVNQNVPPPADGGGGGVLWGCLLLAHTEPIKDICRVSAPMSRLPAF